MPQFHSKEQLLLQQLLTFFSNSNNLTKMMEFVNPKKLQYIQSDVEPITIDIEQENDTTENKKDKTKLSLRLLDWFVTNYAKQYNTRYIIRKHNRQTLFMVYQDYKQKLDDNTKKYFDPFNRGDTFELCFGDEEHEVLNTSIRQMHFFMWAIRNKVIDYLKRYIGKINQDMKDRQRQNKLRREVDKRKRQLSVNATKITTNTEIGFQLDFFDC